MYGTEQDPVALRDAVVRLRDDEEYSPYFMGSGATGSGMSPARTAAPSYVNNPFASGSVNATKVAELMQKDPDKARRLMNEARLAGKLDPVMSRVFS